MCVVGVKYSALCYGAWGFGFVFGIVLLVGVLYGGMDTVFKVFGIWFLMVKCVIECFVRDGVGLFVSGIGFLIMVKCVIEYFDWCWLRV